MIVALLLGRNIQHTACGIQLVPVENVDIKEKKRYERLYMSCPA
jgi:hypothetical protein